MRRTALLSAISLVAIQLAIRVEASDCKNAVAGFVRQVEKKIEKVKDWKFTPEQEADFAAVFAGTQLTDFPRLNILMWKVMNAKFDQRNPVSRFFIRRAARTATGKSFYDATVGSIAGQFVGPHYNPLFNAISYGPFGQNPLIRDIVTGHEMTHAVQRNTTLWFPLMLWAYSFDLAAVLIRTPVPPMIRFRMESEAIGSQWEVVKRIPPDIRKEMVAHLSLEEGMNPMERNLTADFIGKDRDMRVAEGLPISREHLSFTRKSINAANRAVASLKGSGPTKTDKFNFAMRQIAIASLLNAELPKEAFVDKMKELHHYRLSDLAKSHLVKMDIFRGYQILLVLLFLKAAPIETWLTQIPAKDLRLLFKLLGLQ